MVHGQEIVDLIFGAIKLYVCVVIIAYVWGMLNYNIDRTIREYNNKR